MRCDKHLFNLIEHATDLTCSSCTQGAFEKSHGTVKNIVAPTQVYKTTYMEQNIKFMKIPII